MASSKRQRKKQNQAARRAALEAARRRQRRRRLFVRVGVLAVGVVVLAALTVSYTHLTLPTTERV